MSVGRWDRTGDIGRVTFGTLVIILVGYLGIVVAPVLGVSQFWPNAGIWAAVGWGSSRMSLKPALALIVTGFIADLTSDAPLGCWVAVHLVTYLTATLFRRRSQTDQTGLFRTVGDLVALLVSFLSASWIMGGFLGGMDTTLLLSSFLTTALLYLPVRSLFVLQRSEWVDG